MVKSKMPNPQEFADDVKNIYPDGNIKDAQELKNLITTVGLNMVRDFLYGNASSKQPLKNHREKQYPSFF